MAFMKHGAAMPAKTINMGAIMGQGIGVGARVRHQGRVGTVNRVEGAKASIVFDGIPGEATVLLSSLTQV